MNLRRFLYGLAGAALTGLAELFSSGIVITWKTAAVAVAGAVAGYLGTKRQYE